MRMTEIDIVETTIASSAPTADGGQQSSASHVAAVTDDIIAALRTVFDPEIPVNLYDLGLIYRIEPKDDGVVDIDMTLTAPGCPVAGEMLSMVEKAVGAVAGIAKVNVNLVFDPPWDKSRMSEDVQLELGLI